MRFLVNENVSSTVIAGLRADGHDVLSVKESMRGAEDVAILRRAQAEARVLVSHDRDFGELAYRRRLPAACGVVFLRLSGTDPEADNRRALSVLNSRTDWAGHFTVVTHGHIRIRPLPEPQQPPRESGDAR